MRLDGPNRGNPQMFPHACVRRKKDRRSGTAPVPKDDPGELGVLHSMSAVRCIQSRCRRSSAKAFWKKASVLGSAEGWLDARS